MMCGGSMSGFDKGREIPALIFCQITLFHTADDETG